MARSTLTTGSTTENRTPEIANESSAIANPGSAEESIVANPDTVGAGAGAPMVKLNREELRQLAVQARYDEKAAAQLFGHLERTGTADAYCSTIRDAASMARRSLIELCCSDDQMAALAMERRLEKMQNELAGPDASALEKQLGERIALCWLQVHYFESLFAANASDSGLGTLLQHRIDAAHRRHLSAIKALALVRKLQIPVMQFNLAEKQVNIGSVCS